MSTTTDCITVEKSIRYSRHTHDYDCYLIIEGEEQYIGSEANYSAAERRCAAAYYDLLERGSIGRGFDLTPEEAEDIAPVVEELNADAPMLKAAYAFGSLIAVVDKMNPCEAERVARMFTAIAELPTADAGAALAELATFFSSTQPSPPATPAVQATPWICDDRMDTERYGQPIGVWFTVEGTELCVPDPTENPHDEPVIYPFAGREGRPLTEMEAVLPRILALTSHPKVQLTRARVAAGLPAVKVAA